MSIPRFPLRNGATLWIAAGLLLVLLAAVLRFYNITEHSVTHDEALAALNSRAEFAVVQEQTRANNTAPILYPLALWVIQKIASTPFTIRIIPALASVLTVAALIALPKVGGGGREKSDRASVSRPAALLAGLLAALSLPAIWHAQDAREYAVDALLAVLLIAGLLRYLQNGKPLLLCAALLLAPLLQYGLALFSIAVLLTALITTPSGPGPERSNGRGLIRIDAWARARLNLLWPAGCFATGCLISLFTTARYQWQEGARAWSGPDGYLAHYYYQGGLDDPLAIVSFSATRTWELLAYHIPPPAAVAALVALAVMVTTLVIRRQFSPLPVLAALSLAIASAAAVLGIYPYGASQQNVYLGPVLFLAAAIGLTATAALLSDVTRRRWLAPTALALSAAGIAIASLPVIPQAYAADRDHKFQSILTYLDTAAVPSDTVYIDAWTASVAHFYIPNPPDNYRYGQCRFWDPLPACVAELRQIAEPLQQSGNDQWRLWAMMIIGPPLEQIWQEWESTAPQLSVQPHIGHEHVFLWLITDRRAPAGETQLIRSNFEVRLNDGRLLYVKEPCAPADTAAGFFLHLHPVNVNDLPEPRRQHGFDIHDFTFQDVGTHSNGKCTAQINLPNYPILWLKTGQISPNPAKAHLWSGAYWFGQQPPK